MDSPLIPLLFLLSHPDNLIALLSQEVWDDEVVGKKKLFSPITSLYSTLSTPGDQRLSQWGLGGKDSRLSITTSN
jgi:hypothetical protein